MRGREWKRKEQRGIKINKVEREKKTVGECGIGWKRVEKTGI